MLKVFKELQELHNKGIVHGDLSFNNIIYNPKTKKVDIIDFGFANKLNPDGWIKLPIHPSNLGKYFAPESKSYGLSNQQSDIYTLGYFLDCFNKCNSNPNPTLTKLSTAMVNPDYRNRVSLDNCIKYCENELNNNKRARWRRP